MLLFSVFLMLLFACPPVCTFLGGLLCISVYHLRPGIPRNNRRDNNLHALQVVEEVVANHEIEQTPRRAARGRRADDTIRDGSVGIDLRWGTQQHDGGGPGGMHEA